MRLLPYLYSAFAAYHFEGVPPIRPMAFEDAALGDVDDQFMFGPSILVAPFYGKAGWSREIVLPAGRWYDFYTGAFVGAGGRLSCRSDTGRIPAPRARGRRHPDAERAGGQHRPRVRAGAGGPPLRPQRRAPSTCSRTMGRRSTTSGAGIGIRRLSVEAGEGGRLSLRETIVKDDAPPMFGRSELRAMTR